MIQPDPDEADLLAVALVTAMIDRFDAGSEPGNRHRHASRIAAMITDARLGGDLAVDDYIGALGVLAARAVEDLTTATGEPVALWLTQWLAAPYGVPPA